jgi:predicted house-cleaning noncanonical NTP pyrophosphatase (MazG superfamily)
MPDDEYTKAVLKKEINTALSTKSCDELTILLALAEAILQASECSSDTKIHRRECKHTGEKPDKG